MSGWVNKKANPVGKKHRQKGESWFRNYDVAGESLPTAMRLAECDQPGKSPDTYAGFWYVLLGSQDKDTAKSYKIPEFCLWQYNLLHQAA